MMSEWQLSTPVAFFVFNRPATTARVFEAIRSAAPPRLLVVADGPRPDRDGEAEKCAAVRAIVAGVDWPCEVSTNFSHHNLGCRQRVSSGLAWVFETVEQAVILEDDCLPQQSFFRFCEELLKKYRNDDRVMMISGDNFQFGASTTQESYYFSRYPHIWGWASWRRSWELYDADMALWPQIRDEGRMEDLFSNRSLVPFWREIFDRVHRGEIDTWDHQFTFCCMLHHGLCIFPAVNLVSNIGFGADATHTRGNSKLSEVPTGVMQFPLRHPSHMIRDVRSDRLTEKGHSLTWRQALGLQGILHRVVLKVRGMLDWQGDRN